MLSLQNITKKYGQITAVEAFSLEIPKGEFFGLLGPNGAGKTTLIRMITSLTAPTEGRICIKGQEVDRNRSGMKSRIGIVSQHMNLEGEMTAAQNMELHGRMFGMEKGLRQERSKELLAFAELSDRANSLVSTFSGGMKRKLMIARALMHDPEILLLDEPTVGLDAAVRRKMWDLLRGLNKSGLTVILTTHYIEEAEALCDRVGMVNGGRLVELDSPAALIKRYGEVVLECFDNGETQSAFFNSRQEAMAHAATLEGSVNIRPANLEDTFIQLTNRKVAG